VVTPLFRSARSTPFDRLYEQHAASVYRYARAVLGNHADAEDVTQQTFLNVYRAIAQGTKPRRAENWIFTIAHNEVRRHFRDTRAQRLEVELDTELAEPVPERAEPSVADVLRALQHLTPNQRSALVMREFEGRSYAEIAEIMGLSQSALETLIFRARRGLAEALEDGITCAEAELAVSRRLDGRLSRREARRLKKHIRECKVCKAFDGRQRRQRSLLEGLSVIPVPASLLVFRGESAAAALGWSAAVGAATGGTGIAAKVAAVTAAVTVAGGVGYSAGTDRLPVVQDNGGPAPRTAVTPVARSVEAAAPPVRVGGVPGTPVVALRRPKPATVRRTTRKPVKPERIAAKRTPKAAGQAERKEHPPIRTGPPVKVKESKPTPPPRANRPAPEPKAKQAKKPPRPAQPANEAAEPKPETKVTPAPIVPPGLEKKLLDPPKPEKPKLP
jgi:RNA polymerase sigma-70 factor (ECF subfamily)